MKAARRLPALVLSLCGFAAAAAGQSAVPAPAAPATSAAPPATAPLVAPLPPPTTRTSLRGRWFEYLSALNDDDFKGASLALADILKMADRVGITRLSDFARAAIVEARRAEALRKRDRARAALDAAIRLDPSLVDSRWAMALFEWRAGERAAAAKAALRAVAAISEASESRREAVSDVLLFLALSVAVSTAVFVGLLVIRYLRRMFHDGYEIGARFLTERVAAPVGAVALGLPLWFTLGPFWVLVYWAALLFLYASRREKFVLTILLVLVAAIEPAARWVSDENVIAHSPLVAAAVDLAEQKEEGGVVDLVARASKIMPNDDDVWYLLGRFAERRLDYDSAAGDYARSLQANPGSFRAAISLGNIHFWEGNLAQAIEDYRNALKIDPHSALGYYDLSLAQGDSYQFSQQNDSLAKARHLSAREVDRWIESPTLSRVLSVAFPVTEARARTRRWGHDARSQLLPGITHVQSLSDYLVKPAVLAPLAMLLVGLLLDGFVLPRGLVAAECSSCGTAICRRCRAPGGDGLLCPSCSAREASRHGGGIDAQVLFREQLALAHRQRRTERRFASLLVPGAGSIMRGRPVGGFLALFIFVALLALTFLPGRVFPIMSLRFPGPETTIRWGAALLAGVGWIVSAVGALRS